MLEYYVFTNVGNRKINEDCADGFLVNENEGVFILADGVGGYEAGEVASGFAIKYALDFCRNKIIGTEDINTLFTELQKELLNLKQDDKYKEMMTTLVFLYIKDNEVQMAHVGDSRLYHLRNDGRVLRTYDHSVTQMLCLAGHIKEEEIRIHPKRNQILKAMGDPEFDGTPDVETPSVCSPGDAFLLCTDGFWEYILEQDMYTCLEDSNTPEEWINSMAAIVAKNGVGHNMDNFTAIGVMVK